MSIFEYVHRECNHWFELLIQGSAEAVFPKCKATKPEKQFSAFGVGAPGGRAPFGGKGACGSCGYHRRPGVYSMN